MGVDSMDHTMIEFDASLLQSQDMNNTGNSVSLAFTDVFANLPDNHLTAQVCRNSTIQIIFLL